ncbi:hypothetical protein, partial [Escherichia coli]|uniref:hypothetical protein n=2 Tax=Enterobacterales TaxID=91347 RepID=UPI00403FCC97|nr:hypothetical protein [Escherichia coli]
SAKGDDKFITTDYLQQCRIKEGYLADILLIEGNPLSDIRVLQDPDKIALVMKDGVIYKNNIAAISDSKKYQPRLSRKRIEKELHH